MNEDIHSLEDPRLSSSSDQTQEKFVYYDLLVFLPMGARNQCLETQSDFLPMGEGVVLETLDLS